MATHGTNLIEEYFLETGVLACPSGDDGSSYRFHKPATSWPVLFAYLDVLAIWSASFLAVAWHLRSMSGTGNSYKPVTTHLGFLLLYSGLVPLFSNTQRLYSPWLARSKWEEMIAIGKATLLATILLTACIYISGIKVISREVIFTTM